MALAKPLGVTGVQIGTLVAYLPRACGWIRFVVGGFFGQSVKKYLLKHTGLFVVVLGESAALHLLTRQLPITVSGIFLRFLAWGTVPLAVDLLIYFRDPHFKDMCGYFKMFFTIIAGKIKQRKCGQP